jgi:hypothetical protein
MAHNQSQPLITPNVRFGSEADISVPPLHVRSTSESAARRSFCLLCDVRYWPIADIPYDAFFSARRSSDPLLLSLISKWSSRRADYPTKRVAGKGRTCEKRRRSNIPKTGAPLPFAQTLEN